MHIGVVLKERYQIQSELGRGGFSVVYKAWDQLLNRHVAIKEFLIPEQAVREREIMTALLNVPFISRIIEEFVCEGKAYIVMSLLEGEDLFSYCREAGGTIPTAKLLPIMEKVIFSVEKMHKLGFIHRDISPKNIMITKEGEVCLIDFGAALSEDEASGLQNTDIFEHKGFHAPEFATPSMQGTWTDIYSICATFVYLLTGNGIPEKEERRKFDAVPMMLTRSGLTTRQQNILLKGLKINPEERCGDAFQLRMELYQELYLAPDEWKVQYFAKTDQGARKNNQDNLTVDGLCCYEGRDFTQEGEIIGTPGELHIAAICDGVGGATAGELAAKAAVQALNHFLEAYRYSEDLPERLLEELLDQINEKIIALGKKIGKTASGISLLLWKENHYYAVNIGDSPILLLHKKKLTRLSTPHTMAQQKIRSGQPVLISDLHTLTRYLGKSTTAGSQMMSVSRGHIEKGDVFLLCSDGVTNIVENEKLRKIMIAEKEKSRKMLWKEITKKRDRDNCSVVLLHFF